jgi:hypothetical protein
MPNNNNIFWRNLCKILRLCQNISPSIVLNTNLESGELCRQGALSTIRDMGHYGGRKRLLWYINQFVSL